MGIYVLEDFLFVVSILVLEDFVYVMGIQVKRT